MRSDGYPVAPAKVSQNLLKFIRGRVGFLRAAPGHGVRGVERRLLQRSVNEPNRIVGVDVIVHRVRQEQQLIALESGKVSHARF